MNYGYEGLTARELARFAENGGLYKGKKPVHWCSSCVTALAEAEVEYADHTSPSIFVKFPLKDDISGSSRHLPGKRLPSSSGPPPPGPSPPTWPLPPSGARLRGAVEDRQGGSDRRRRAEGFLPQGHRPDRAMSSPLSRPICWRKSSAGIPFTIAIPSCSSATMSPSKPAPAAFTPPPATARRIMSWRLKEGLEIYNPVDNHGKYLARLSNSSAASRFFPPTRA